MKTLKDYLSDSVKDTSDILEVEEYPIVSEANVPPDPMDPPAMLIMRRKSIRAFPNGQRVALYYVDKIHKYVTVPYTASMWASFGVPEETIIDTLNRIVESGEKDVITHIDESVSNVSCSTARALLSVYNRLTKENQEKFINKLASSKSDLKEAADFCFKNGK